MQELFRYHHQGYSHHPEGNKVRGYFTGCNMVPTFYEDLLAMGVKLDINIFKPAARDDDNGQMRRAGVDDDQHAGGA